LERDMTANLLLRKLRQELGWTQKEMSKRLGVGQGYLSKIENGRLDVPLVVFRRAFRLSMEAPGAEDLARAFVNFLWGMK